MTVAIEAVSCPRGLGGAMLLITRSSDGDDLAGRADVFCLLTVVPGVGSSQGVHGETWPPARQRVAAFDVSHLADLSSSLAAARLAISESRRVPDLAVAIRAATVP